MKKILTLILLPFISFAQLKPVDISNIGDKSVVYIETYDKNNRLIGSGSGVVISNDGKIVTNYHVYSNSESQGAYMKVKINNLFYKSIEIIKYNIQRDYLIFRINNLNTVPIAIGNSEKLNKGQSVYAIGTPLGYENTFSDGLISGFRKTDSNLKLIQHTAPISPGSSGGALLNQNAELIGINVSVEKNIKTKDGSIVAAQDIGFAIPINDIALEVINNDNSQYYKIPRPENSEDYSFEDNLPKNENKPINPNEGYKINPNSNVYGDGNGQITIYTSCEDCTIDVFLDNNLIGILSNSFEQQPFCGQQGAIVKVLSAGKHRLYARDSNGNVWDTYINIIEGSCLINEIRLEKSPNFNKGINVPKLEKWSDITPFNQGVPNLSKDEFTVKPYNRKIGTIVEELLNSPGLNIMKLKTTMLNPLRAKELYHKKPMAITAIIHKIDYYKQRVSGNKYRVRLTLTDELGLQHYNGAVNSLWALLPNDDILKSGLLKNGEKYVFIGNGFVDHNNIYFLVTSVQK